MKRTTAIVCLFLGCLFVGIAVITIFMVNQPNEARNQAENTEHELPAEIMSEMEHLFLEPKIHISRWAVDTVEKRIDIFVWKLTPENEQLNGKVINGWTINVTYDEELMREEEKIFAEVKRLEEKPEMQIAGWSMGITPGTGDKKVVIIVYNLTPENQQLHGKMIDGWKVYVWKSQVPPGEEEQ